MKSLRIPALTAAAVASLFLASCERQQATAPTVDTPAPATKVATRPNLSPEQLDAAAFHAAWGAAPPVVSRTSPDAGEAGFTYQKGVLVPLGGSRFAYVSDGAGGGGHVDSGALSIHYLNRTAGGFERIGAWPEFVISGTFGNPPEWSIRADLTPGPALIAEGGGVWQGYACASTDVVELTPGKPVMRAAGIHTHYSSGGAREDDGETVEGALAPGQKGRSFRVRYTGDRNAEVAYVLSGETYSAATTPDLPTC